MQKITIADKLTIESPLKTPQTVKPLLLVPTYKGPVSGGGIGLYNDHVETKSISSSKRDLAAL